MMNTLRPYLTNALLTRRERLDESYSWYPFPLLLAFMLVMVLMGHSFTSINERLGSPADIVALPKSTPNSGSIWFSVTPVGESILIATGTHKTFILPQSLDDREELQKFTKFLQSRVREETFFAGLSKDAYRKDTTVVIAADQHLRFKHLRPILVALAEAKITNYAFETRLLTDSEKTEF